MRRTITLEDDVADKLDAEVRRTLTFKTVVNDVLRRGLLGPAKEPDFIVRTKPLGLQQGLSYDNVEKLLDGFEGPLRR